MQTVSLQVTTDVSELTPVLAWFDNIDHRAVPSPVWLGCKTALAEVFTNVVRHAHQGMPPETSIDLEVTLTQSFLLINVFDHGPGFDLSAKLAALSEIDVYAEGGRGLFLIAKIMDVFTYTSLGDSRNCLQIVKYF